MRVLILGGTGMLGHAVHRHLAPRHEVVSTTRRALGDLPVDPAPFLSSGRVLEHVDATDLDRLREVLTEVRPDAVLNAIGVIKQRDEAADPITSIRVNALFPHRAAAAAADAGARLIHVSTDCVFSGDRGAYVEDDESDAHDLYGRTKFLGEVRTPGALTLRTSVIGRELHDFDSLVEWFLRQRGVVPGFTKAIYTGLTTAAFAEVLERVLVEHPGLSGLLQVAAEPIAKFDLLEMIHARLHLEDRIELVPDDGFVSDRSLLGDRFVAATGIDVPSWSAMVDQLAADADLYRSVIA
jgi:dTDP-4-dehydrorhamnose reductase